MPQKPVVVSLEPVLRRLAAAGRPHAGCVDRALLRRAGIRHTHEPTLLARGALTEVIPAVFVLGGVEWITQEQLMHVGLLAVGTGGRLAGRTALEIRGAARPEQGTVHVTRSRPSPQARVTIEAALPMADTGSFGVVTIDTPRGPGSSELVRSWPLESTARSMRQFAASEGLGPALTRIWREADFLGLLDASALREEVGRGRPGSAVVRALLASHPPRDGADRFRSKAEYQLLEALLVLGVPRPRVNCLIEVGGEMIEADFFFPESQLIAEVDGPQHDLPTRREEDARRDDHLRRHGIEVLRFSDEVATSAAEPCATVIAARRLERMGAASRRAA